MMKKSTHRTPKELAKMRAEDRLCDLEERIAKELPSFIKNRDRTIAEECERRYDIPVATVLNAFATDHDNIETTLESILRALHTDRGVAI